MKNASPVPQLYYHETPPKAPHSMSGTQHFRIPVDLQHELMSSVALHNTAGKIEAASERDVQMKVISPDAPLDKAC